MNYLLVCAWVACLGIAFCGFGLIILRMCGWPHRSFALSGAVGACVVIALGGLLNPLHLITAPVIYALVFTGVATAAMAFRRSWRRIRFTRGRILWTIALAPVVLGNIHADVRTFNVYDDLPAYLTIPAETYQLNTLPADPFNERRVTSSLGAPYFLQALVLPIGSIRDIRAMDVSIAWPLYLGLIVGCLDRLGLNRAQRLGVAVLILVLPVFRINTTFVILPAALFCALFLILLETRLDWRRAILLALVASALTALKSNYLPAAVLMCAFWYAATWTDKWQRSVAFEAGLWAFCTLTLLLPWMFDLHIKEGTFLFPLLGRGFDASAYGTIPAPNGSHAIWSAAPWVWITALSYSAPYLVGLWLVRNKWRGSVPLLSMLLSTVVAITALAASTGGESIGRYSLPFQIPCLIFLGVWLLRSRPQAWRFGVAVCFAYATFMAGLFGIKHGQYRSYLEDARLLTPPATAWFDPAEERNRARSLQGAIPPGDSVLARLFVSYSLDFKRNTIYIADYSGMAGPPFGMPLNGSSDTLRAYLLQHRIRYLAYDYVRTALPDDDPGTTVPELLQNPTLYGRHHWLYLQVKVANFEQRRFAELGSHYRRIYDDGEIFVLDLTQRASAPNQVLLPDSNTGASAIIHRIMHREQVLSR